MKVDEVAAMKQTVPTNWQNDLLDKVDLSKVAEIYGKLDKDVFGGGRPAFLSPRVDRSVAKAHIAAVHAKGLRFNYLLNSTCMNNFESTAKGQRALRSFLDWLTLIGVDSVTVSIPYILCLIKKCYPHFEVSVSTMVGVDDPERARYWEDMGASQITLIVGSISRRPELLRRIRAAVRCQLQLIANLQCLSACPFQQYHSAVLSHDSQSCGKSNGLLIDWCFLSCRHLRLKESWRLIAAAWIRPEDQHFYADIGIDKIKLVDRNLKTDVIARIVSAYTHEKYEGNLLDLMSFHAYEYQVSKTGFFWKKVQHFFHPFKVNLPLLHRYAQTLHEPEQVHLDNQKLEGFLSFFMEGKCHFDNCTQCGHCQEVAQRVITVPPEFKERRLRVYEDMLADFAAGRLFHVSKK